MRLSYDGKECLFGWLMTEGDLNNLSVSPSINAQTDLLNSKSAYLRKPGWWSLLLLYSLPIWWMMGLMFCLVAITEFCFSLNFNLVVMIGPQLLLAPFIAAPLMAGLWLLVKRRWFSVHMAFALPVWFLIAWASCITQGAMNSMLDRAMAIPGRGKYMYEDRVPYNQRKPEDRHFRP